MTEWKLFKGTPQSPNNNAVKQLMALPVPPWRDFRNATRRGQNYVVSEEEKNIVNAAILLRRPVLVTGEPGAGKSSLAYAIAEELHLGKVLKWPINSRSTLTDGLYQYDAIGRLREANLEASRLDQEDQNRLSEDISRFINLQWLGTALASPTPRVLLIDEIDKADVDLPNDLLHVLEEGSFAIPELVRLAERQKEIMIPTCEQDGNPVAVPEGNVTCSHFPIIIMTSNDERELPPAFHRRCLRLDIKNADEQRLEKMVYSHLNDLLHADETHPLPEETREGIRILINEFISRRNEGRVMANDQLLNLVFLLFTGQDVPESQKEDLKKILFRGLNE